MAVKNSKTRPADRPYEIWKHGDWTWNVLKFYSNKLDDPYTRVFCVVTSPFTLDSGDMGDVYYRDIRTTARLVHSDKD